MKNKPNKPDIQQNIDNLKELYNTSFFDGDIMKENNFDIFIAIDRVSISPDMKIRDVINSNPISFKLLKDGKTIGLENVNINLNDDIESFFIFTKRVLENIKEKAPAKVIPDNTIKNEDSGSDLNETKESEEGEQSKEIEFRTKKYYYFPSNMEKVYRMDDTIMKKSNYTSSLIEHIKSFENENK